MAEHGSDGITQMRVDAFRVSAVHIHIDNHYPARSQMTADLLEKLDGAHLERNGDVAVGINHDHIIFVTVRVQKSPAVIGVDRNGLVQIKVSQGQFGDFLINLHPCYSQIRIILLALGGISACSHAQNQNAAAAISHAGQSRGHQGIVVIHAGQSAAVNLDGLDAEHDIG